MTLLAMAWYVLPAAVAIDLAAGDPPGLPHPVRLMGRAVERLEPVFRKFSLPPGLSGFLFALCLVGSCFLVTLALVLAASAWHPLLGVLVQLGIIYTCLSSRCLYDEALRVRNLLASGDIEKARAHVGMLVSRDVNGLDGSAVARAGVETVAENFVDGVLSPLFYAAILGAPGAAAFKMASTLDSMVGYKNERYFDFGRASARLDDLLNWIPARLSIPVIALSAGLLLSTGRQSFQTALREGKNHSSPNAGIPEAAFAGALGVKINGPGMYHGRLVEKPWIGEAFAPPRPADIEKAGDLMLIATLTGMCAVTGLHVLLVLPGFF